MRQITSREDEERRDTGGGKCWVAWKRKEGENEV